MTKSITIYILFLVLMFAITGCTDEQQINAAQALQDVNTGIVSVVNTPIGQTIPEPYKVIIQGGSILIGGLLSGFLALKRKQENSVLKSVINAIEKTPVNDDVKDNVKKELEAVNLYSVGKSLISKLKN